VTTATISACIAELAAVPDRSEDRVRVGWNAVVVLDGASGTDCGASVSDYVELLAGRIIAALDEDPGAPPTERSECGGDAVGQGRVQRADFLA